MTRQQAKLTIRSRVVVKVEHIKSLHSVDEVIDQLCDEHEDRMKEKDKKIEYLQQCIDARSEFDKRYGEEAQNAT